MSDSNKVSDETLKNIIDRLQHLYLLSICKELQAYRALIPKVKETLAYYADEKNWYNVNEQKPEAPEFRMVIGSVDTTGDKWIGGHQARQALKLLDEVTK